MRRARWSGVSVIVLLAACSPTQPTRDCGDSGPLPDFLNATCSLIGSIVSCQARTEDPGLYCTAPSQDVTQSVQWVSTNLAAGRFVAPGRFEFSRPGGTVIYVRDARLVSWQAYAFAADADGKVRQVSPFDVVVLDSRSNEFLWAATVQFTVDGGPTQTCRQDAGPPSAPCRFWFDTSDANASPGGPRGTAVASKPGYSTESQTVTLSPPTCPTCSPNLLTIRLSPG
jgi:hypothetical protein